MMDQDPRYPIGDFKAPEVISDQDRERFMATIRSFPALVEDLVKGLDEAALAKTYRPGGWSVRQLVHHVADSHMNSFIRFKLTTTEDNPTIKPYDEDRWAEQPDYLLPVEPSLKILSGVHARWVELLENLFSDDWDKEYIHPGYGKTYRLDVALALYDWHCRHHLAHLRNALLSAS